MIVLHGIYDHGKIEITEKELPNMKAEIEIIIRKKTYQRKNRRIKLLKPITASETLIQMRSE